MCQEIGLKSNQKFNVIVDTLLESTLEDLNRNTVSGFPGTKKRQHSVNNVRITRRKFTQLNDGQLLVKAECDGETQDYQPQILFTGIKFTDPSHPQSITLTGGIHLQRISNAQTNVQVSCNCLDFHWTFAWFNSADGSLLGKPPEPYSKHTDRQPRNPDKVPGLCKHLIKLSEVLKAEGLIG